MTIPSASNGAVEVSGARTPPSNRLTKTSLNRSLSPAANGAVAAIDIIDIRHDAVEINLKEEILRSLRPEKGPKEMPTLLLYDETGLQLFEQITYLPEYFLTNAEIDVLESSAHSIANAILTGSMVVELGSGNLRKVSILLKALEEARKDIDYYALDLSLTELQRTLANVPPFQYVKCHGLHGTYDDGLDWLKLPEHASRPKVVMSLGSSIGNFHRYEAPAFLKSFAEALQPSDSLLVGLDACDDPKKVYHAYNDHQGITHKFILNGLVHANKILEEDVFNIDDWKVIGEYVYDDQGGRHQAFYSPVRDVQVQGISIRAGERVQVEQSLKYSAEEATQLWSASGLMEIKRWTASNEPYNVHLLAKQSMSFGVDPAEYAATTIPSLADWHGLWKAWDTVTRGMIPDEELLDKPIKLRNACIFYLGHIPTFLDVQLKKATEQPLCEPTYYSQIFERGIDPDVDNPELCHAHSEIPDEWPQLDEILTYQDCVRGKVEKIYNAGQISRKAGRALWIGFEHEIMHLETLLYILLQSDKTLPPTSITPDFEADARRAKAARVPNQWFKIPSQTITIGLDDPDDNSGPDNHFGWDNEKPSRQASVKAIEAQGRPITNEEYARYLEQTNQSKIPASWAETKIKETPYQNGTTNGHSNGYTNGHASGHQNGGTNGYPSGHTETPLTKEFLEGKSVRTVYGLIPLKFALDWPVFASYDELAGCAKWMGGRIPTAEETRSIYKYANTLKMKEAERHLGKTVPAVNSHLLNDGVEESPPFPSSQAKKGSSELFANLEGANIGFKNWHPVAVTGNGNKLAGQAEMGGVWEWTSSPLANYEGFEPMSLYPAYTADFFDGKHNIILGGSWATHPRIAGRKTL
ncbi:hypothetical protein BP6252_08505 [Coleophoma cylindrospora]|uniref:Uncharacterized protein n=1 Tax=Coleophoma cylindrospora TaxID=1849047 RepID=A0A3D8R615_9HELO|nr:hypothetical protein BP6252_08505 [Coleophoma cylindrospora]